jgi:putative SOS response-associated peptidase YedK
LLLTRETPTDALAALLVPHFVEGMRAYPVSSMVNTPQNQDVSLIEPAGTD